MWGAKIRGIKIRRGTLRTPLSLAKDADSERVFFDPFQFFLNGVDIDMRMTLKVTSPSFTRGFSPKTRVRA
jgi:hypothetical protein